ncbi:MAG: hypothetical protein WA058_02420 [Minisyncoccia bacterium]
MRSYLLIAVALILPIAVSAQSLGGLGDTGTSFTVSVNPQYPVPNGTASLSFLSSTLDLANTTLSVSVGGTNIYQGSVRPVAVTLGKAGSITNIVATIVAGGISYKQTLSIQPQDVVLIAEPISSAPMLYRGKPSVPLEGDVRVVAMANLRNAAGKAADPSTLSYSWTVDGAQIANSSGIGKTAIIVASPLQYRARDVSVAVMNPDGALVGGDSLSLSATDPLIRLYENDPLLGIRFDRALPADYSIIGSEAALFAAPFSLPTTSGIPFIQWFLNGETAQTGNSITLRPSGSGQGSASLSLTASSGTDTTATANILLKFNIQKSSNFFGL